MRHHHRQSTHIDHCFTFNVAMPLDATVCKKLDIAAVTLINQELRHRRSLAFFRNLYQHLYQYIHVRPNTVEE